MIPASQSLFPFLTQFHPPEFRPTLGHLLGTDPHTLSRLTRGELVSCPPELGMLVDHFALGPAHLVCVSVCVLLVPSVYPLAPWSTLTGTLQWGHRGCNIYGLLHDS